jgi:hypothetical protein
LRGGGAGESAPPPQGAARRGGRAGPLYSVLIAALGTGYGDSRASAAAPPSDSRPTKRSERAGARGTEAAGPRRTRIKGTPGAAGHAGGGATRAKGRGLVDWESGGGVPGWRRRRTPRGPPASSSRPGSGRAAGGGRGSGAARAGVWCGARARGGANGGGGPRGVIGDCLDVAVQESRVRPVWKGLEGSGRVWKGLEGSGRV